MDEITVTRQFADFVLENHEDSFSEQDIRMLKTALLDWIAVTLAGSGDELVDILLAVANQQEQGGDCTVIAKGQKAPSLWAAVVNGTSAHALDFDDIHDYLSMHFTVPVYSSAVSVAEELGASGKELLNAMSNGMQAMVGVAEAVMPEHYTNGWHATATVGIFGAVAACGYLYKLTPDQLCNALGIAASKCSGLQLNFGTMTKPMQPAQATRNALESVLLAKNGFTASIDVMDNRFWEIMSSRFENDLILPRMTGSLAVYELRYKRFPSGAPTHAGIINCHRIMVNNNLELDDIDHIVLEPYPRAIELAGNPRPQTGLEGKFSIPFCAAASIVFDGSVTIQTFTDEVIADPRIQLLLDVIEMVPNDTFTPSRGGRATIYTKSGESYSHETFLLGQEVDPEEQVQDVREKYLEIAEPMLGEDLANRIFDMVFDLENLADVKELISLL